MSPTIPRTSVSSAAEPRALVSIAIKVPGPGFPLTSHSNQSLFFQSYSLAAFTILFYDHLLTLSDEVCRNYLLEIRCSTETTCCQSLNMPGLERNRGVRPPLDKYTTFYLSLGRILAFHRRGSWFLLHPTLFITGGCRIGTSR